MSEPMSRAILRRLAAAVLFLVGVAAADGMPARAAEEVVREQRAVMVQGAAESWRLVWDGQPGTLCGPDDMSMATTCPCAGFAYAEYGKLTLVRSRNGRDVDRLDLHPLFAESEYDAPDAEKVEGAAWLQRRPLEPGDPDRADRNDPGLLAEIENRPAPPVMELADYDRDGAATEFLIPIGTLPCGKLQYAAVGLPAKGTRLRALASAAHPRKPIVLPLQAWQALRRSPGPSTVPTLACGEHASEVRSELVVAAQNGRIRVKARDFSCPPKGRKEKLVEQTDW